MIDVKLSVTGISKTSSLTQLLYYQFRPFFLVVNFTAKYYYTFSFLEFFFIEMMGPTFVHPVVIQIMGGPINNFYC